MSRDIGKYRIAVSGDFRHYVNAERLALMKPTAFVINTARGPADEPLFTLDSVIVTPHSLCWTDECFAGIGAADVRATLDVMHEKVPRGIVNRQVTEDPRWQAKLKSFARLGAHGN